MKKKFLLLSVFVFASIASYSQDNGYLAISFGSTSPIGDFASKNPDNSAAGYANTGAYFDISSGYKLGSNLGIAALFRVQANPTDAQAMADAIAKEIPGFSGTYESGAWAIGGFMFGGYGSFPINEKLSFESRLLFGFLTATSPDILVTLTRTNPYASAWIKQKTGSASAFSHLVGVGFKYDVGARLCLLANLDYLGAKPEFRNVEITSNLGISDKSTYSQSLGTINIGFGLGVRL